MQQTGERVVILFMGENTSPHSTTGVGKPTVPNAGSALIWSGTLEEFPYRAPCFCSTIGLNPLLFLLPSFPHLPWASRAPSSPSSTFSEAQHPSVLLHTAEGQECVDESRQDGPELPKPNRAEADNTKVSEIHRNQTEKLHLIEI